MFARHAKEDFESGDLEKMQYIMKALGAEMKLLGRTCSEQRSDTANGSNSSEWWGLQGLNL